MRISNDLIGTLYLFYLQVFKLHILNWISLSVFGNTFLCSFSIFNYDPKMKRLGVVEPLCE